ncbi:hypothetical protein [Flavobacterium sp. RSSB_23]|uniref:hypothetical protein n=1 Tax=Flavobacterium sp. RSSB_23 TaxID=3447668 RepID=UPI003F2F5E8D
MNIVQHTDEEFNVFYYSLKNKFKTTSKVKSIKSDQFEYYSKSVNLKIDSCFETIFRQRFNSSLFHYYKQVFYEVKDENERNFKIISQVIDNFYDTLNYYYTEITESRYFYFLKPLTIEKKLGFQKGDNKFKNFVIKLILHEMRFEDGNFILLDETYGTIINVLIAECVKNIRHEMIQNTLDLDCNDLINDINKLEIEKNIGQFDFLDTSLNLLRILKADIKDKYEELKRINQPQLYIKSENNDFTDINNNTFQRTTNNNNYTDPQNKNRNLPKNAFEKKETNRKLKIEFSPIKFSKLMTIFFENAGIQIDPEKKNRINRFILNTIEFDKKKYTRFNGSPSIETINFFNKDKATILKFCALLKVLIEEGKMKKISDLALEKLLIIELKDLNEDDIGISTNLRNKIRDVLKFLKKEDLAKYAGFKNCIEIKTIIMS